MRTRVFPTIIVTISGLLMTACGAGPGDPSAPPLAKPNDNADTRASRIITAIQMEGLRSPNTIITIKQNIQTFPGNNVTSAQVINALKFEFNKLQGMYEFKTHHTPILDGNIEIKSLTTNETVVVEVDPESDTHSAPIKTTYRRY